MNTPRSYGVREPTSALDGSRSFKTASSPPRNRAESNALTTRPPESQLRQSQQQPTREMGGSFCMDHNVDRAARGDDHALLEIIGEYYGDTCLYAHSR